MGTSAACWCERRFRHVPFQGRSRIDYIICCRVRKENRPRALSRTVSEGRLRRLPVPLSRFGHGGCACPLYPSKQTKGTHVGLSASCQNRTNAPQQKAPLFDHLVGNSEQLARPTVAFGTKRTGSIKLDRRVGLLRCMRPLRHLADMHSRARLRGSHPGSARPNLSRFGQCDCPAIPIGSIHPRCEVMRSRGCAVRESCTPASAGRVFFPHMRGDDVIYPRPALRRDVPKSPFTPTGSASAHRRASHFK